MFQLIKEANPHIRESQQIPNKINKKKSSLYISK